MRVGARIEIGGRAHEIARLKRDRNSLVDADNRPIDETFLKAELAGVDRAAFRMMFSLDDESLEKGGEAILASRGDLGQLLFSASAGLAEFSARLDALRERAGTFYRPGARKTELAERKRALEALKDERDKADTFASTYAELVRQRDEAERGYEDAAKVLAEAAKPRGRASGGCSRRFRISPRYARRRVGWPRSPICPRRLSAGASRPPDCRPKRSASRRSARAQRMRSARSRTSSRAIANDPAALEVAGRVDDWRESRSRYDTAMDIPVRQGERDAKREAVADVLRMIGREGEAEPQRLLLTVTTVGALERPHRGSVRRRDEARECARGARCRESRPRRGSGRSRRARIRRDGQRG